MSLKEKEEKIAELEKKLAVIKNDREIDSSKIEETINDYKKETYSHLCAYDRVYLARKPERSHIHEFIDHVFDEFVEMRGDRYFKDDQPLSVVLECLITCQSQLLDIKKEEVLMKI